MMADRAAAGEPVVARGDELLMYFRYVPDYRVDPGIDAGLRDDVPVPGIQSLQLGAPAVGVGVVPGGHVTSD